jgi:isocitrate dehydrogenase
MTHYTMNRIMDRWIRKNVDISQWEFFDLSCKKRDETRDKVLKDAVAAGKRVGSIFKEPTVTPNEVQVKKMGLSKAWGSPNGAMRRGWNGITISRDTIHIKGMELGYKEPVLFDRHAVGGEYSAGWSSVRQGEVKTVWIPKDGSEVVVVDRRQVTDNEAVVYVQLYIPISLTNSSEKESSVTYDNPLDNVTDLAHHFFSRCLAARVVPYVVTKKTVFKWQSLFWEKMVKVFDEHYRADYIKTGIIPDGKLKHLISDSATMQIVRWTGGGFGMAAHNYDGDMLTDEIVRVISILSKSVFYYNSQNYY